MASYHPRHRNIFVQFLPSQSIAVDLDADTFQLLVGGCFQPLESGSGKSHNPPIRQLHINESSLGPRAQSRRFCELASASQRGIHCIFVSVRFDIQTRAVLSRTNRAGESRDSWRAQSAPAKTYTHHRHFAHEYEPARSVRRRKNGTDNARSAKLSALN